MKKKNDYTKLRGGYYTPEKIAAALVNWAAPAKGETILEPSAGNGAFLKAVSNYCRINNIGSVSVKSVELDPGESSKSNQIYPTVCSDYFSYFRDNLVDSKIDVLLGNPPFIRYQNFKHEYRDVAFELMDRYGFHPNKLTNIWVPFLLLSSELLSDRGRIAMVIPAELFQVNYAAEARNYLMNKFSRLTIVLANEMLFQYAQQEIVLILGEASSENPGVYTTTFDNFESVANSTYRFISEKEEERTPILNDKWTRYYLSNYDIALIDRVLSEARVHKGSDLFDVNVGVVTGDNDYFIIDEKTRFRLSISQVLPIVTGTDFFDGIRFTKDDFELKSTIKKAFLFYPDSLDKDDLPDGERLYVELGENSETPLGFKCRNRKCWYEVPVSWKPDAFFFRQVGSYPRIVLNEADSYTTDTLHKIRFKDDVDPIKVTCSFLNSFTCLCCELIGRSYGGGVLTFEPGEVRSIPIPVVDSYRPNIGVLDSLIRQGRIEEVIKFNDQEILGKGMGFSNKEIEEINRVWTILKNRRLSRKIG